MAYAKTSLRREKKDLREQMRSMGLGYRDIAAEFARRYRLRPRAAWREAYGWSLQETADRINTFRGQTGLDPGGFAGMTAPHLSEHENWPGHSPRPSGRRPTPYLLAVLAAVYDCAVTDLIDLPDRQHMPPADLLILDKYSQPAPPAERVSYPATPSALSQAAPVHGSAQPHAALLPAQLARAPGVLVQAANRDPAHTDPDPGQTSVVAYPAGLLAPAGAPQWASALCHAVADPARAARDAAAATAAPGEGRHSQVETVMDSLRRETRNLTTASLVSDYGCLAANLPGAIGRAELTQVTGSDEALAAIEPVLSDLYAVAAWTLIKADQPEAAWVAATRSVHAAAAAGDCLRSAAATRCLAEVHMRAGRLADAARVAFLATAHLDAVPQADKDVALCLRGAAMLSAAAAAARRGDSSEAHAALRAARAYAAQLGRDVVVLGTMFGPVNVAIHDVAVPVELGRPGEAVRSMPAGPVSVPAYLAERKARFLIDIARAHAGVGDTSAAGNALLQAEQTAPEEMRHHRLTRQLLDELLPHSPRSSPVRELAARCEVPC